MKVGAVTKLDKKSTEKPKSLTMISCLQILTSLSFLKFLANLQPSKSLVPDEESKKIIFL